MLYTGYSRYFCPAFFSGTVNERKNWRTEMYGLLWPIQKCITIFCVFHEIKVIFNFLYTSRSIRTYVLIVSLIPEDEMFKRHVLTAAFMQQTKKKNILYTKLKITETIPPIDRLKRNTQYPKFVGLSFNPNTSPFPSFTTARWDLCFSRSCLPLPLQPFLHIEMNRRLGEATIDDGFRSPCLGEIHDRAEAAEHRLEIRNLGCFQACARSWAFLQIRIENSDDINARKWFTGRWMAPGGNLIIRKPVDGAGVSFYLEDRSVIVSATQHRVYRCFCSCACLAKRWVSNRRSFPWYWLELAELLSRVLLWGDLPSIKSFAFIRSYLNLGLRLYVPVGNSNWSRSSFRAYKFSNRFSSPSRLSTNVLLTKYLYPRFVGLYSTKSVNDSVRLLSR